MIKTTGVQDSDFDTFISNVETELQDIETKKFELLSVNYTTQAAYNIVNYTVLITYDDGETA